MFAALARFSIRRSRTVLVSFFVLAVVAGLFGGRVARSLQPGGFFNPASESSRAEQRLVADLGIGNGDVVALYTSGGRSVQDPQVQGAVGAALDRAAHDPAVQGVAGLYNTGASQFASREGDQTFAVLTLKGSDAQKQDALKRLRPLLQAEGVQTRLGGTVPAGEAIQTSATSDLERAELIAFPITAVLLVAVFGSLVSAALPLVLGGLAIVLALLALRVLALFTGVSIFALNVVTTVGLGLAIYYSLFILNRYREELPRRGREEALVTAISTTGRAVAFSGLTLAASLAGLFLFPQSFLRSMAMGGIAVALLAVLIALTVLPALITVLGPRTEALRVTWYRPAGGAPVEEEVSGFWHTLAMGVMRRPAVVALVIVALLLGAASPFLRFRGSTPDVRVLPASAEARQVSDTIAAAFQPHEITPSDVVLSGPSPLLTPAGIGELYDFELQLAAVPGVARVESLFSLAPGLDRQAYQQLFTPTGTQPPAALTAAMGAYLRGGTARFAVISTGEPDSAASQAQVQAIRRLTPPAGTVLQVGGAAAQLRDLQQGLKDRIPLALAFVAAVMFVVLFLLLGSVTLPFKAILMNLLSLSASYGAMVWIFQDGRLQGLLRFSSQGSVDATQPILMFAIVFGLSMDYEVLLLSRIHEEHLRTGDNTLAVARGIEKTGRLITSAAALLVVVFAGFSSAGLVFMKELGVGMTLAIALDATVVRALLVPATMRLMGRWNWWAPGPLRRLQQRAGFGEFEGRPARALPAAGD